MGGQAFKGPLEKVDECVYQIPKSYKSGMRVDGRIFVNEELLEQAKADQAPEQVANVACLPGIQEASIAMPDIHWGYGFCIGGVAATDPEEGGVISPGGVGYDINCGVRLIRTDLTVNDVKDKIDGLISLLFKRIPAGVGEGGPYKFSEPEMRKLLSEGVRYLEQKGLATKEDVEHTEEHGSMKGADPDAVSREAMQRGYDQCGTLGSGNHFLEVQVVDEIFDREAAEAMGLREGGICVMIHSGSRGLGHQVCSDALKRFQSLPQKYGFVLPDKQLACAPVNSPEGQWYLNGMRAAANFAWANRQLLMWQTRKAFEEFFGQDWDKLGMQLVYDVAHNIAKLEKHKVGDKEKTLCVHRKGATRAFPAGHPDVPEKYRHIGQPVIIPGDMGRSSWVLVGQPASMEKAFGTTCHGAGRLMSRHEAVRHAQGRRIDQELAQQGIVAKARSRKGLAEEQPAAYKDVSLVVDVVDKVGLAKKVARLRPLGVIKG